MSSFKQYQEWALKQVQASPRISGGILVAGVLVGFYFLFSGTPVPPHQETRESKPRLSSVQEAIDPRAVWVDQVHQNIEGLKAQLAETRQGDEAEKSELRRTITELKQALESLRRSDHPDTVVDQTIDSRSADAEKAPAPAPEKKLVHLHRTYPDAKGDSTDAYVTSGSFCRAVLLTGVVAETGTDASGAPQPILLRLVDHGIFSKGYRTKQLKEAVLIGSCYGNISSERALCRLERLSLMNREGAIVERPVEGWVIGEDGRPGLKGDVVDKSSDVTRMAILGGILSGISGFFQNQATSSVYPVSPITGQTNALPALDSLKAGAASGVGNAMQKLADYAIKRAEQMSPVILVGSGRVVDVVFKKGLSLKKDEEKKNALTSFMPSTPKKETPAPPAPKSCSGSQCPATHFDPFQGKERLSPARQGEF